jgi:hypothetical protein
MTRTLSLAAFAAGTLVAASPAAAGPQATAQTEALILKPLVLTKLDDLSWGTITATGTGDWAKIDADTGNRTFSNPAMDVPSDRGKRARFASSGLNNSFVVLELAGPTVLTSAAGDTVSVMQMVLDQNNKVLRTLTPTSQVFFVGVGGTIYVGPNQASGTYSGTYTLTATYL